MLAKVLEREIAWHRELAKTLKLFKMPASEITKYTETPAASYNPKQFMFRAMSPVEGRTILDFGCGSGVTSVQLAMMGAAKVVGFDLSPDLIKYATYLASLNNVARICEFHESNALTYDIGTGMYDRILIDNVMHHLPREEFPDILDKINKALKPNGIVVFREPVNYLPWLNSFKLAIGYKADATEDEHELGNTDVNLIATAFELVTIKHFSMFDRVAMSLGLDQARSISQRVDSALLNLMPSFMSKFAGTVVITGYPRNK